MSRRHEEVLSPTLFLTPVHRDTANEGMGKASCLISYIKIDPGLRAI